MTQEKIKVGIVGAAGRGSAFSAALKACKAEITAVCDICEDKLDEAAENLGASQKYTDYDKMLEESAIDAVIIGTPMQLHVPQSIAALKRGVHVLCEVPAAVSVKESKELVIEARKSKAVYMLAENYCYMKHNVLIANLARLGKFGKIYYAEGEYIHELKKLDEITVWRRKWQAGIAGVTYGTHSLGPILNCLEGDRVVKVCCEDADYRWKDPRGDEYANTTPVMLCKTAHGALVKIRVDMISDRPHAMTNYQLQGSDGAYESSRGGPVDNPKLWLRELNGKQKWVDVDAMLAIESESQKYLPEHWVNPPQEALQAGHGGGDYFEVLDFFEAIRGNAPCPIDIDRAMDFTLPGLISQKSILEDGRWMAVPDSRNWL